MAITCTQLALSTPMETISQVRPALSLRSNFAWTLAGNVTYACSQWGMTVALARMAGPEGVGQFALALALTAPIVMLSNLQLRGVQATDTAGRFRFSEYFGLRLLTTAIALSFIVLLGCVSHYAIATLSVIVAVACAKSFESLSDVCYGQLQQGERMDRIAISMAVRGLLSVVALATVLWTTRSLPWACAAMAAVWLGVLWAYDLRNMTSLGTGWDILTQIWRGRSFTRMRALAVVAAPLGAVMMLLSLNSNVPRYFIERSHGFRELGIFAAVAYFNAAGTTVISALGQSATPRLANLYAAGNFVQFRELLGRLVGIGLLLGICGILGAVLCGSFVLRLVYGRQFAAEPAVLVWVMAAASAGYVASFLGYGLTAAQRFKIQLPIFAGLTVLTVVLCWQLVPHAGAIGAAQAMLLTGIVQVLVMTYAIQHSLRRQEGTAAE